MLKLLDLTVAVLALTPGMAVADRGALSLEMAPALTIAPSSPSVGSGSDVTGSMGGGLLGLRYALRNDLEVSATGFYEAPATLYHSGVEFAASGGTFSGTLIAKTCRYGMLAGARYVTGLVFRIHLGAEIGWSHQTFSNRDLLNVSDPANPHSYGLGLGNASRDAFVLAPLAGIEWQVGDHWSLAATPRLELLVGGVEHVAIILPVSVAYSWFVF